MARCSWTNLVGRWGLIALTLSGPAYSETFEERWPHSQLETSVWPDLKEEVKTHKVHKVKDHRVFVCHKRYYFKRGYRYWRCKR
jgi:hypothetical protein